MSVGTSALLIGGGIAAAGTVGGALIQSSAAGGAQEAQVTAQREAITAQREESERARQFIREGTAQARADIEPFRQAQVSALQQLQGIADPQGELAQAEREQATQTIQRQLSAQGLLRSRRQTDLLQNLELGLLQRRSNILGGLAGSGAAQQQAQLSAGQGAGLAQLSQQFGAQIGSAFQNIGEVQAGGALGRGQALGGAFQGIGNIAQGTAGNLILQDLLSQGGLAGLQGGSAGSGNLNFFERIA